MGLEHMEPHGHNDGSKAAKPWVFADGKLYFSRQMERRIFFVLTMVMLIVGLCTKCGFIS